MIQKTDQPPIDLEKTLRYLAVADEFRRRRRAVAAHLETTDRERIREHLLGQYARAGTEEDPRLIDEAIDQVLAQQFRFREPPGGFRLWLALAYVRRRAIALVVGLPLLVLGSAAAAVVVGFRKLEEARLRQEEIAVEIAVESIGREGRLLAQSLAAAKRNPLGDELPEGEKRELQEATRIAGERLGEAESFSNRYAPEGSEGALITRENFAEVRAGVPEARSHLEEAAARIRAAGELFRIQKERGTLEKTLTALLERIRAAAAPDVLLRRAVSAHAAGIARLGEHDLTGALEHIRELEAIHLDARALAPLAAKAKTLAESIRGLAKEKTAVERAAALAGEAEQHAGLGEVEKLRGAVTDLNELAAALSQEYRIVITGGVWRYHPSRPGVKNFYLRVQARDARNRAVRVEVRNEESGRTETVTEWAERVPEEIYNRVGADKKDNGIIDDSEFGSKERGFLTAERKFENLGQITRW